MANPFESEKSFHRLSDHLMEEKGTDDDGERRSEGSGASVPLEAPASFVIGGLNEESPERSLSQPDSKLYNPSSTSDIQNSTRISMDAIAKRLLSENLILSALELHTELTESGREVKRLRDYFSNPANFEPQTSTGGGLQRTNSVQTFDSFDMNGSDLGDVQGDDKMAVLEFELRKAREVIQNLRKQLTTASELSQVNPAQTHEASSFEPTEALVSSAMTDSCYMPSAILPHEQRAINFLAHEYLLQQNYKLTSVTFSDEVADQDFEDWDEVGLNLPRPADLMSLYREFCHATPGYVKRRDAQTGCDLNSEESPFGINNAELLQRLNNENSELLAKNEELSAEIGLLSADIEEMKLRLDIKSTIDSGAAAALEEESSSRKQKTFIVSHTSPITKPVAAEIERHRSVPVGFAKYIRSKQSTAASKDDERLLTEISSMASNADELVSLLSRCLPQIVPNVLINKREELIPLLICAMVLHSNTAVRDQLLSTLYNLVKKPDERQRQMILAGCDAFARYAGPMRAEAELLPQCWEQINHKHVERRLLVAETCGVLAPSLPPALLSSLVLSMLQQMIVEDKSEDVRMAAVLSLASVCLYIEDRDKFSQVSNVVQRALTDSSQKVIQSAQSVLLPSFAVWAESIGKLQLGVAALFVRKLLQLLQTSGINQAANEAIMCNYISSLKAVTPVLYWSVIRSGTYDQTEAIEGGQRNIASDNPVGQLIFEGDSALERQRALFEKHTAQEWFTSWDSLDFVTRDMLPQLVSILGMLEVNLPKTVSYLIDYFQDFCRTFGHGFCVSKLRPLFTPSLNIAKNFAELSKEEQSKCGVGRATLPVYCAGVLSAVESPEDWQELRRFLRWKMSSIAEAGAPTAAVAVTFSQLCRRWSDHESLLQIVWESLPHKNVRMRAICAEVLSRLALETSGQLIKSKVVPGLVTLAADSEPSIRISTVSGFANVIQVAAQDEEMMDKVKMQLSSMFEDTDASVVSHLVHLIAQSAPTMDSNFRDEFVLPHLSQLVERNASSASKRESSSVSRAAVSAALFDAYSAISCCFLSPAATADYFIPGLRALMNGLDPQHVKIAASILRDAENKLAAAEHSDLSKRGSMMMGDTSVEDMRNKMVNTFRDIKGKVDFPKDAVPNIFRKKPN